MVTVRAVRPDEWRRWRELRLQALAEAPDAFGEVLAVAQGRADADWIGSVAGRADRQCLVAERDGVAVGMMVVVCAGLIGNVYAMWVSPAARRSGVGRALVTAGLAWLREAGALDVSLRCSERHPGAAALYRACGFAATGEREPVRPGSAIQSDVMTVRLEPLVMGVVNVTPDSFSDGGEYMDPAAAVEHGLRLMADGADILDVGGEATNPRARPVAASEELRRIEPVIAALVRAGARVSVDTTKSEVARAAVATGATIVNDVSGGRFDAEMIETVRELGVRYVAGHLRGRSLAEVFAAEGSVSWETVATELMERVAGLPAWNVWVDPGLGFGKGGDPEGNVALLRHTGDIAATVGRPIVVGASRKRFVRRLADLTDGASRDAVDAASTLATLAALRAGAHVVRVHNVALLKARWTAYNKK